MEQRYLRQWRLEYDLDFADCDGQSPGLSAPHTLSGAAVILLLVTILLSFLYPSPVVNERSKGRIMGFRIYGTSENDLPVAILDSTSVTVEFDVDETPAPNVRLRFVHCDRNWRPTATPFLNDEARNTTQYPLPYEIAPAGVQGYRFSYRVRLPGLPGIERFPQSGNYELHVLDEAGETVLARGKFFVVESLVVPSLRVTNRILASEVHPMNKAHRVEVRFQIPERVQSASTNLSLVAWPGDGMLREELLYPQLLTHVDIYRNREFFRPYRIDPAVRDPYVVVDGYGTRRLRYAIENVLPGNEYRQMDLRDIDHFPPGQPAKQRLGADLSRFFEPGQRDHDGASIVVKGGRYADYLTVQWELLADLDEDTWVDLVGGFNGWCIGEGSRMRFDERTRRYVWEGNVRRGVYDYYYVVNGQDPIALEGNHWRTTNLYSAFLYYRDQRFGGFDRIIGSATIRSSGSE